MQYLMEQAADEYQGDIPQDIPPISLLEWDADKEKSFETAFLIRDENGNRYRVDFTELPPGGAQATGKTISTTSPKPRRA